MTGGYKATRTGRTMKQGYAVWDCSEDYYYGGLNTPVYASFEEAAKAARVAEMRDVVTRQRAGIRHGEPTGRTYAPVVTPKAGRLF